MSKQGIIRLVKSLSSAEKRHFKLSSRKQSGNKDYLTLFEIIDDSKLIDLPTLEKKFQLQCTGASLENAAKYLLKVLTDSLIQSRTEKDSVFQQHHNLMRVNILFERSLLDEGHKELKRVQQQAAASQNHFIQYLTYRYELDYLSDQHFPDLTDKGLLEIQMKARHTLKSMHKIHEHHSLFELLKHRLVNAGKTLSEDDKKHLNDLLLSELSLITGKVDYNFESQKLHLLFQSFFFTHINDYKSALKIFQELNGLFESNPAMWKNPPLDYLSCLEGILDSLRTIRHFDTMTFYINKLRSLTGPEQSEYFNFIAAKTIWIYQLNILTGMGQFKAAAQLAQDIDPALLKEGNIIDYEKQSELLFYLGLSYFGTQQWDKANKYINRIILMGKINYHSPVYKAARLLNILIHYEQHDLEYLPYEIRSYKRSFQYKGQLLKIEKLLFKIISIHPNGNGFAKNQIFWKKVKPAIGPIEADKYELQLQKYFDFLAWIKAKFKHIPLQQEMEAALH
jgi:hypothetical protein